MDSSQRTERGTPPEVDASRNGDAHPAASSSPANQPQTGLSQAHGRPSLVLPIMRIVIFLWVGLVLAVLPWQDHWAQNAIFIAHPAWRDLVASYFTRGVVSGLGVVDLWIAASEIGSLRR
jgi:hypothetical protein